jgi:hypothetical protein
VGAETLNVTDPDVPPEKLTVFWIIPPNGPLKPAALILALVTPGDEEKMALTVTFIF